MEHSIELPQQIKNSTVTWPSNSTSGHLSERLKSKVLNGHLPTRFVAATLTVVVRVQKHLRVCR